MRNSSKCVSTGFGDKNSKIMFVLLCKKDDYFEGISGKILQNAIKEGLNLEKDSVYISSLLRCEISQNDAKNPALERSFELCRPYLLEEIRLIKPKIIITLGEEAFMHFYPNLLTKGGFSGIRGSILKDNSRFIMPTFSPEWISKNPSFEENFIDDLKKIKGVI
ncbi:uracil-DNA glycosylase family protein [uncultured Campylobacter sp.]|uniref:uracil-DNA glycosylase family protein n=1 Tax=uncultured Campylobacter sp. TaxID=218934 RepID=UPI00260A7064|nr:uracil-DNA glycosylase family protein [uncultured Campylobacter sp.]